MNPRKPEVGVLSEAQAEIALHAWKINELDSRCSNLCPAGATPPWLRFDQYMKVPIPERVSWALGTKTRCLLPLSLDAWATKDMAVDEVSQVFLRWIHVEARVNARENPMCGAGTSIALEPGIRYFVESDDHFVRVNMLAQAALEQRPSSPTTALVRKRVACSSSRKGKRARKVGELCCPTNISDDCAAKMISVLVTGIGTLKKPCRIFANIIFYAGPRTGNEDCGALAHTRSHKSSSGAFPEMRRDVCDAGFPYSGRSSSTVHSIRPRRTVPSPYWPTSCCIPIIMVCTVISVFSSSRTFATVGP